MSGRPRILAAVVLAVLTALGGATAWGGGNPWTVHRSVMADCEDQNLQPCITWDEGAWRRVDSYAPYAAHRVRQCTGTHRAYPCVRPHGGLFDYYWRGRF